MGRVFAMLLALGAPSGAGAQHIWSMLNQVGEVPPARWGHALVWDENRRVVVLHGGESEGDIYLSDTWEWSPDTEAWIVAAIAGPPPRARHAMVYHRVRQTVILYAGFELANRYDDLWEYDTTAWTQLTQPATQPPALWAHAMAYDSVREAAVLWGGRESDNTLNDDVWDLTFPGDDPVWTRKGAGGPGGRMSGVLVFETATDTMLAFGGRDDSGNAYDDLWSWSGILWQDVTPAVRPSPRNDYAMAWDSDRELLVLHGGRDFQSFPNDEVWEGGEGGFSQPQVFGAAPTARNHSAMVFVEGDMLLFGGHAGSSGAAFADTYLYRAPTPPADGGTPDGSVDAGSPDGGGNPDGGATTDAGSAGDAGPDGPRQRYGCTTAAGGFPLALIALLLAFRRRALIVACLALGVAGTARGAAPQPSTPPSVRLAFVGLVSNVGTKAAEVEGFSEYVQSELAARGAYDIRSMSEVRAVLGFEAQRQLLGCSNDARCAAELGDSLAVDRMLTGSVSRLGNTLILNLSLIDLNERRTLARVGRRVSSWTQSLEPLLDEIGPALDEILRADPDLDFGSRNASAEPPTPPPSSGIVLGLRVDADILSVGGVGLFGGWRGGRFGAAATALFQPLGLRLEGRLHPVAFWRLVPYLALGCALFTDSVGLRAAFGTDLDLGSFRLYVDLAYERTVVGDYEPHSVLVGGGVGWVF